MLRALNIAVERLGWPGKLALVLLAATAVFLEAGLRPLEAQSERLGRSIERATQQLRSAGPGFVRTASPQAKLAAFYRFFQREESTTDWLPQLHAISEKSGLPLASPQYRLLKGPGQRDSSENALPAS